MADSMYWYRQGTVSVTAGSNVINGVNTYWQTAIQPPVPGDALSLDGTKWFEIAAIETDNRLRVHGNFTAALTNVPYMVKPVISAAPALRISAEISAVLQQQRQFFLTLNDFWYKPGEVSVIDPFGVTHTHKTLYELNAELLDLTSRLTTLIVTGEDAVDLFDTLQQGVNALTTTVDGMRAEVDTKLNSAANSAINARTYRDTALQYRNDAQSAASTASGSANAAGVSAADALNALNVINTKYAQVNTWHSEVSTRATDVTTKAADVVTKSADVTTKAADVVTKHGQMNTWYSAVNGWQATVNTKHAEVVTKHGETLTAATNAQSAVTLAQRWASENENVVVASGLYSARHYMLLAYNYAQQTAANVSGGVIFRGFLNPASGFPAGAITGDQYKLSGSGTLTFEVEGAKAVTAGDYIIKTVSGWVHLDDATDAVKNTRKVNNKSLAADITLTPADVGAVPTTRTVNGKPLSVDIALTAADVGARVSSWVPAWTDVTGKPTTVATFGITDAVTTAGDQTIAGNKTFSNQLTAGNLVAVQAVVSRPFGGEGGQFVLGYPSAGAIAGQANLTWNIDVDSSNRLRFFRFDGSGNSLIAMYIRDDTGEVNIDYGLRLAGVAANKAPLNIVTRAADPTVLVNGDVWHAANELFVYLNGAKRTLIHNGNPTALASDITQADAEAGTGTGRRWFTAERVKQAIAAQAAPKAATEASINRALKIAMLGMI